MKAYITEIEILDDVDDIVCRVKAFDADSFSISIDDRLLSSNELREIAELIESDFLKNPVELNKAKG